MTLDESKDDDQIFEESGITYVIEKELYERAKPLKLDYVSNEYGQGFKLESALSQAECGGSCSSC